jgi:hypothetical protein
MPIRASRSEVSLARRMYCHRFLSSEIDLLDVFRTQVPS